MFVLSGLVLCRLVCDENGCMYSRFHQSVAVFRLIRMRSSDRGWVLCPSHSFHMVTYSGSATRASRPSAPKPSALCHASSDKCHAKK
ncbi:uncharacterized protein YALI1_F02266g [Yarrowia lipolytica]|uniref:Secreted protein n=1 Tax=Yarrowia lipolytica TaxID=4952 RepID=A0A1D8NLI2_YARLL|nr:hypothetical protein YALI1_F02266g [Yarrowia lipolytica]